MLKRLNGSYVNNDRSTSCFTAITWYWFIKTRRCPSFCSLLAIDLHIVKDSICKHWIQQVMEENLLWNACLCSDLTILFFVTDGVPRTACGGSPRLGLWNTEMGDGTDEENHVWWRHLCITLQRWPTWNGKHGQIHHLREMAWRGAPSTGQNQNTQNLACVGRRAV